nr:transcription initiation factor IIA subunit 1 [Cryptomonas sp.]
MNRPNSRSTVNEVYFYVIELTIEAVRKYLEKSEKLENKYNIPNELKTRWQARISCLFHSLESSWSNFQESGGKYNEYIKKKEELPNYVPLTFFPLICTLSWDILRVSCGVNEKTSGFKSWVWNCLIGRIISEGVHPQQSYMIDSKYTVSLKKIQNQVNLQDETRYKKDIFNQYESILNKKLNFSVNSKRILVNWTKKNAIESPKNIISHDSELLGSDLDQDIESQVVEETGENSPTNFILSIADKVYRRNSKWRVLLRDGILHVNGRDLLFNLCKCEFFW